MAPVIKTARLALRPHRRSDLDDVLRLWSDAVVVRHIGGVPATREQAWQRLLRYAGHWVLEGHGFWAVDADGAHIGDVGLFCGERGIGDGFEADPEAGWAFLPAAHGHGYAREAMAAVLAWGERTRGFTRTVCMIEPANAASVRTAERLGYREFRRGSYHGAAMMLMERLAADHRAPEM